MSICTSTFDSLTPIPLDSREQTISKIFRKTNIIFRFFDQTLWTTHKRTLTTGSPTIEQTVTAAQSNYLLSVKGKQRSYRIKEIE